MGMELLETDLVVAIELRDRDGPETAIAGGVHEEFAIVGRGPEQPDYREFLLTKHFQ